MRNGATNDRLVTNVGEAGAVGRPRGDSHRALAAKKFHEHARLDGGGAGSRRRANGGDAGGGRRQIEVHAGLSVERAMGWVVAVQFEREKDSFGKVCRQPVRLAKKGKADCNGGAQNKAVAVAALSFSDQARTRPAAPSRFPYGGTPRRAAASALASASSLADIRVFSLATSAG